MTVLLLSALALVVALAAADEAWRLRRRQRRTARLARDIQRLEESIARDDYLLRPRRERAERERAERRDAGHFIRVYHAGRLYHKYDDGRMVLVTNHHNRLGGITG